MTSRRSHAGDLLKALGSSMTRVLADSAASVTESVIAPVLTATVNLPREVGETVESIRQTTESVTRTSNAIGGYIPTICNLVVLILLVFLVYLTVITKRVIMP